MAKEWVATCKDCGKTYLYSDYSYQQDEKRGFSRPERCPECRIVRRREIEASGTGYFQIRIVSNEPLRPGILGEVFHGERPHVPREQPSQVSRFEFGIKEDNIRQVYRAFDEEGFQVAIIEGPTGSGKSTYLPFRLIEAPGGVRTPDLFTRDGQIIVTQPRVLPTSEISQFISESLNGSSVGQGSDIGYKFSGANATDRRNRLVFVTDGTLINWIKNDQLGHVSVIMIDEAHERSKNIDLILMLLRTNLPRYPRLKLIIASATIRAEDFIAYYGGPQRVRHLQFDGILHPVEEFFAPRPAVDYEALLKKPSRQIDEDISNVIVQKTIEVVRQIASAGPAWQGDILAFLHSENSVDLTVEKLRQAAGMPKNPAYEIYPLYRNLSASQQKKALEKKPVIVADRIVRSLLNRQAHESVLIGVVLDTKGVRAASEALQKAAAANPKLPKFQTWLVTASEELDALPAGGGAEAALVIITSHVFLAAVRARHPQGQVIENRRVIIATNVAETSLTVDGTVHVIDSGLIKQNIFDSAAHTQRLVSIRHSQAGCRQRRGRAGRIRPGFAHYLYTAEQFEKFLPYTPPEIERSSLEDVLLQAKASGIGNLDKFPWFNPTQAMLKEVQNSAALLQARGALDADGDITTLGLNLLSMQMDTLVSTLLLSADQYCCAVEAGLLLGFLTTGSPLLSSLFLWNRGWDSQTRWEVRQRRKALFSGVQDDFELVLRTIAAWESSGNREFARRDWARQMYVNHAFIQDRLFPARQELLDTLSSGLRGRSTRQVDLNLLDRLRFAAAVCLPDQVHRSGSERISPDSCCWAQAPAHYVALSKTPFKIAGSGERSYRAGLLGLVDPGWINEGIQPCSPFTSFLPVVHRINSRDEQGKLLKNPSQTWVSAALFPPGTVYDGQPGEKDGVLVILKKNAPAAPILEVGGWERGLVLAAEHTLEDEVGKEETAVTSAPVQGSASELAEDEIPFEPPQTVSRLSIFFSEVPFDTGYVKMITDQGLTFENVSLTGRTTVPILLAPGDHHIHLYPYDTMNQPIQAEASIFIRINEGSDYIAALGRWRGKRPSGVFVLPEKNAAIRKDRAALRWLHLGWKNEHVELEINGKLRAARDYYEIDPVRPVKVEAFHRTGSTRNKLAQTSLQLSHEKEYTLILHHKLGKTSSGDFELIQGPIPDANASQDHLSISVQNLLAPGEEPISPDGNSAQTFRVLDSQPGEKALIVRYVPEKTQDVFKIFCDRFSAGDTLQVEPLEVDLYPNPNENAILVREPQSRLVMAVRAQDLFFDTNYSAEALQALLRQPRLDLDLERIDAAHRRVRLTGLDRLAFGLAEAAEAGELLDAQIREVVSSGYPRGLVVHVSLRDGLVFPALIWEERLVRSTARSFTDFGVGETVRVELKNTGGQIKNARLSAEQLETFKKSSIGSELVIHGGSAQPAIRINRAILAEELTEILAFNDHPDFQWVAFELFRRSNQPQVGLVDQGHLDAIQSSYTPGSLISAKILHCKEKSVEVFVSDGVYGTINISAWGNTFLKALTNVAREGDEVRVEVVSIKKNGHLMLSRLNAALRNLQVNERYEAEVRTIAEDQMMVEICQPAGDVNICPGIMARVWKNQAVFPGDTSTLGELYQHDQRVNVRITSLRFEKGQLEATITRFYRVEGRVPAASSKRMGVVIGVGGKNIKELQKTTRCWITNTTLADGSTRLLFEAETPSSIEQARLVASQIIPEMEWRSANSQDLNG